MKLEIKKIALTMVAGMLAFSGAFAAQDLEFIELSSRGANGKLEVSHAFGTSQINFGGVDAHVKKNVKVPLNKIIFELDNLKIVDLELKDKNKQIEDVKNLLETELKKFESALKDKKLKATVEEDGSTLKLDIKPAQNDPGAANVAQ